jgi:hypothetical protein
MKRILGLSLMAAFLTFGIGANVASASPVSSTVVQPAHNVAYAAPVAQRWSRQSRTRYVRRNVWQGRRLYRVTYRVTTLRNGRTYSTMVSRVRIR